MGKGLHSQPTTVDPSINSAAGSSGRGAMWALFQALTASAGSLAPEREMWIALLRTDSSASIADRDRTGVTSGESGV